MSAPPISREEALSKLSALEPQLRGMGVDHLYLFGSVARNEARPDSDLDLFVDLEPGRRLGLHFFGIAPVIEDEVRMPVQLGTREGLHDLLRDAIETTAIQVF